MKEQVLLVKKRVAGTIYDIGLGMAEGRHATMFRITAQALKEVESWIKLGKNVNKFTGDNGPVTIFLYLDSEVEL